MLAATPAAIAGRAEQRDGAAKPGNLDGAAVVLPSARQRFNTRRLLHFVCDVSRQDKAVQ